MPRSLQRRRTGRRNIGSKVRQLTYFRDPKHSRAAAQYSVPAICRLDLDLRQCPARRTFTYARSLYWRVTCRASAAIASVTHQNGVNTWPSWIRAHEAQAAFCKYDEAGFPKASPRILGGSCKRVSTALQSGLASNRERGIIYQVQHWRLVSMIVGSGRPKQFLFNGAYSREEGVTRN